MKFVVGSLLVLGMIVASSLAFTAGASSHIIQECPTISVSSSPLTSERNPSVVFEARLAGAETKVQPTYNWTISTGTINTGQGTSVLTVELAEPREITATVTIGGLAAHCPTTASYTLVPGMPRKASTKFGEYKPDSTNAKELLDEFSNVVKRDDDTKVYILAYGGSSRKRSEAEMAGERAQNYLIGVGIGSWRIEFVNGGFREDPTVELWLTPAGATPPKAEPTIPSKKQKQESKQPKP